MTDTSGPAFPGIDSAVWSVEPGMTLRQYYIGCVLQGLCANSEAWNELTSSQLWETAIRQADGVLALLELERDGK